MPPSSSTWLFAVDFHLMRLMSTYWITFFYRWNPLCQPTVVALGTGWKSRLAKRSYCPLLLRSSSSNLLSVIQKYVDIHLLLPLVKFLTGWEENSRADSEEQRGTYKLDRLNKIFWFVLRCEWFRITLSASPSFPLHIACASSRILWLPFSSSWYGYVFYTFPPHIYVSCGWSFATSEQSYSAIHVIIGPWLVFRTLYFLYPVKILSPPPQKLLT